MTGDFLPKSLIQTNISLNVLPLLFGLFCALFLVWYAAKLAMAPRGNRETFHTERILFLHYMLFVVGVQAMGSVAVAPIAVGASAACVRALSFSTLALVLCPYPSRLQVKFCMWIMLGCFCYNIPLLVCNFQPAHLG